MIAKITQNSHWGFVCGRIGVLEARLVSKDFFAMLLAQEHIEDIVPHLQDTFLSAYISPGSPWDDFSAMTERCFTDLALSIREECPSPAPVDLFLIRGDYLNVKNALIGAREAPFTACLLSPEKVASVAGGDLTGLPDPLYATVAALVGGTAEADPAILDMALDGAYLRHMLMLAEATQAPLIAQHVADYVLARAVTVLWRALRMGRSMKLYQQHFLPVGDFTPLLAELSATPNVEAWPAAVGGLVGDMLAAARESSEEEQATQFELLVDNTLARAAHDGHMQTAGPERVFAFLGALHAEIRNLKLIVCGRLSRVEAGALRRRLRECYA